MDAGRVEHLQCGSPKFEIPAPGAQQNSAAGDERRKGHRHQEDVKSKNNVVAEPIDQPPGLGQGLDFAQEEREHE